MARIVQQYNTYDHKKKINVCIKSFISLKARRKSRIWNVSYKIKEEMNWEYENCIK